MITWKFTIISDDIECGGADTLDRARELQAQIKQIDGLTSPGVFHTYAIKDNKTNKIVWSDSTNPDPVPVHYFR